MAATSDQFTPDLLAQPSRRACRMIASARLAAVRDAFDRFEAGEPDALHKLRVALRRLRSWLRGFGPELDDSVRRRTRRRFRRLIHATNAARDSDVWSGWIAAQTDAPARARVGHRFIAARLAAERERATHDAGERLRRRLPRVLDALAVELSGYWLRVSVDQLGSEAIMATSTADLLRAYTRKLRRRLARIDAVGDVDEMHAARIAAKALRYLLDALQMYPAATSTATELSELQDTLGLIHDLAPVVDRMLDEIASLAAGDARRGAAQALGLLPGNAEQAAPAGVKSGLLDLASRARLQGDAAYEHFRRTWTESRLDSLSTGVDALADEIQGS